MIYLETFYKLSLIGKISKGRVQISLGMMVSGRMEPALIFALDANLHQIANQDPWQSQTQVTYIFQRSLPTGFAPVNPAFQFLPT